MMKADPGYDDTYRQSLLDGLDQQQPTGGDPIPDRSLGPATPGTSDGGGQGITDPTPKVVGGTYDKTATANSGVDTTPLPPSPGTDTPAPVAPPTPTGTPPPPVAPPPVVAPPTPTAPPVPTGTPPPVAPPNTGTGTNDSLGQLNDLIATLRSTFANIQAPQVTYQPQTTPAYNDAVQNAILSALQEGQKPVDGNDPTVAPILAAMNQKAQRAKDYNQQQLAERLASQNLLHSGAMDVGTAGYNQSVDEAQSQQTAQVMTQLLTDRRNRLMQALQLGANYLNADQGRQLQAELANVNSALQTFSVKSGLGLGMLGSLLNNQQFYDQLGTQLGEFNAGLNQNAALGIGTNLGL